MSSVMKLQVLAYSPAEKYSLIHIISQTKCNPKDLEARLAAYNRHINRLDNLQRKGSVTFAYYSAASLFVSSFADTVVSLRPKKRVRKPCACCKTTLGTAWNDRYCNMCEYWQGGRTTQARTWDTSDWSSENLNKYLKYLREYNIPYSVVHDLVHINN